MKHSLSAETSAATSTGYPPESVRVIRTLGHGRAARAVLVEATFPDGSCRKCVEKNFAPGRLTRLIYRAAFQSPFAYQTNRDAIEACFYRRRVAAAVVAAAKLDVEIAEPLYVRFDQDEQAWVLAAAWIDGRGIRPAAADPARLLGPRGLFGRLRHESLGRRLLGLPAPSPGPKPPIDAKQPTGEEPSPEIERLVAEMHRLEEVFGHSGLTGSGWQVAPRALVSTANLLRTGNRYAVIDLESGIPAVLVPRYLIDGLRRGALPPFDDLDPERLAGWYDQNQRKLRDRIGDQAVEELRDDIGRLLEHNRRWKDAELALGRRPWRFFNTSAWGACQHEFIRRLQQSDAVDAPTAVRLPERPAQATALWWAGWLPGSLGRIAQRLIGHRLARRDYWRRLTDRRWRNERWQAYRRRRYQRWLDAGRIPPQSAGAPSAGGDETNPSGQRSTSTGAFVLHRVLESLTAAPIHRWLVDGRRRREVGTHLVLLLLNRRYQAWFGQQQIDGSIGRWEKNGRIDAAEAQGLRTELLAEEVRAYTRGFGMHLGLKLMTPILVPAKVGGAAAFLASGNVWFLLPMFITPLLRTAVTLANLWSVRGMHIPHGEALFVGMLPMVGSLAFPLQMFSRRRNLSTFLIREAASKVGRRIPIYGGADSRTEIALIRMADWPLAGLEVTIAAIGLGRRSAQGPAQASTAAVSTAAAAADKAAAETERMRMPLRRLPRTRLGQWLQREANRRFDDRAESPVDHPPSVADSAETSRRQAA